MSTTQEYIPITDIKDDIVLLKDGSAALVLKSGAVNFGLLSEEEQEAIIFAFAQMLNSLSFAIQIVIHSQRLNISSYLKLLDQAQIMQTNPLLANLMAEYRQFIQKTIKENEVLDKKFYVVIPAHHLELGLSRSPEAKFKRAKTILIPRRDQITRQLGRVGLKAIPLSSKQLVEMFYELYNNNPGEAVVNQTHFQPVNLEPSKPQPSKSVSPQNLTPPPPPALAKEIRPAEPNSLRSNQSTPFTVEELTDSL